MIIDIMNFDYLINPNNLAFWGVYCMIGIVILMKSWNKILRFRHDIGTSNWIKKESDKEISKIYYDHIEINKRMKEKYPDYEPLNKFYHNKIIQEFNKRGLHLNQTVEGKHD